MLWIQLIIALLAYLGAKKSGASNTTAALVGVGAGVAAHYATTQTQWGKENLQPINDSISKFFGISSGTITDGTVKDADGNVVTGPEGHTPYKQPDGSIIWLPQGGTNGSSFWSATSDTLKSWGGVGTAAVIGTTAAVSGNSNAKLLIAGGLALVLLTR